MAKPHFAVKEVLLREGVEAFAQGKPIAGIKVLVTEIEGILNVAYRAHTGKAGNTKALLGFAIESAEKQTDGPGTLFLTTESNRYLLNYMFANYDRTTSQKAQFPCTSSGVEMRVLGATRWSGRCC
ncbi:hypothetical protein [Pseudomonas atacamensis]|uniref:hypothetical protein n=1 Tax=Pseudomonas atacamensis TaxID=2565368 RepID=UPI002481966A|nr:hypothetical protein [Pseudomonas atacamensis]WGT35013.1 hypothetical protein QG303_05480 [Pseudomonas atacamensis]